MTVKPYLAAGLVFLALLTGCQKRQTASDSGDIQEPPAGKPSADERSGIYTAAERTFADLENEGAKFIFEKDGKLKTADFSEMSEPAAFAPTETDLWKTLRVLRGKGVLSDTLILQMQQCSNLTECLWLDTEISDVGLNMLAGVRGLKKIRLAGLTAEPDKLLNLRAIPELTELDLSGASLSDESMGVLSTFPALTRLNLYQNRIGDEGVRLLAPLAEKLTWLNLDDTQVTDAAGPTLALFKNLKFLHLGRTQITDGIIDSLTPLSGLEKIHVTRTGISEEGAERLRAAFPNAEVISKVQEQ